MNKLKNKFKQYVIFHGVVGGPKCGNQVSCGIEHNYIVTLCKFLCFDQTLSDLLKIYRQCVETNFTRTV
jgi:hypothetical protein